MKALRKFLCLLPLLAIIASCGTHQNAREKQLFDDNWKFELADDTTSVEISRTDYNDSTWRTLNLPHDWSIESDFSDTFPAGTNGGALPGGIGWYRKTFFVPKSEEGRNVLIGFDGVYWQSTVWINGTKVGFRPNGYISFQYDITPYILFGKNNVVVVRVDNSEQPNSRWYSGSGIYRNVWLTYVNPVHIAENGTYVTTPVVTKDSASVWLTTSVDNLGIHDQNILVKTVIKDNKGNAVSSVESKLTSTVNAISSVQQRFKVENPKLWSDVSPVLYTAETKLIQDKRVVDNYITKFGIRSIAFTPDSGFVINGIRTRIHGVCDHHDLGCLGTAVNKRALERQLQILKGMGVNGIRTSHNPPAPELLQLCDSMGFYVMDEMFDMWAKAKTKYDYSRYFSKWYKRDLTDFVLRDRNHPSVILWSIGNEILEQWPDINTDTLTAQQANLMFNFAAKISHAKQTDSMNVNSKLALQLATIVKDLDPTRFVTSGNNEPSPDNLIVKSGALDVIGFNYHRSVWGDFQQNYPGKPLILTETTSGLMSRGFYMMPSDSIYVWPVRWDIPFDRPIHQCSSYDNCHAPWSSTHEQTLKLFNKYKYISGMFIWTGFDYLGEPTPFGWPSRSSYFGIVDLAGFPKDIYYLYQSLWTNDTVLHLFPHWNWKEGQLVDMWVFYNHADEVELFINGKSQGKKHKEGDDLHIMWRVPFEKGTVKAVSYQNGKVVAEQEIKTAGTPKTITLTPDRKTIDADGKDLSFVTVEVLDSVGTPVPIADSLMSFNVSGDGSIVGTDNGNPVDTTSLKRSERHLFNGKCLVVVQSDKKTGTIHLTATSAGLQSASVDIKVKNN